MRCVSPSFVAALFLLLCGVGATGATRYGKPENNEVRRDFETILDLWRDGRFAELYDRTYAAGSRSRESFLRKMSLADRRPACCWEKMQEVKVTGFRRRHRYPARPYRPGKNGYGNRLLYPLFPDAAGGRGLEGVAFGHSLPCWQGGTTEELTGQSKKRFDFTASFGYSPPASMHHIFPGLSQAGTDTRSHDTRGRKHEWKNHSAASSEKAAEILSALKAGTSK